MLGGWVYIMANRYRGTIYTGVTSDIAARAWQHKQGIGSRFTAYYGLKILVFTEFHDTIEQAITREKQIKKWNRDWKIRLIEEANPNWLDLYDRIND